MSKEISLEEKWEKVRKYYEAAYRFKFKGRPVDQNIEFLYAEMVKLGASIRKELDRARPDLLKLLDHKD